MRLVTYTEKSFKSILNRQKHIDSWFRNRYSINPYNGCQIGCVYCNARDKRYYLPLHFEQNIIVKSNLKELLANRLRSKSLQKDIVVMSGTTDPYQVAERKAKNTRQALELLLKYQFPVHIITKSRMVLRDLDLIENIAKASWATVSVTLTTIDKDKSKFLEKGAPTPQDRLELIQNLKESTSKLQVGALLIPVVPYLTDDLSEMELLFEQVKQSGADYLLFSSGMTMTNNQADWFLKNLNDKYPDLMDKYESLYRFTFNSEPYAGNMVPDSKYMTKLNETLLSLSNKYQLPYRIKRFIPRDQRRFNYILSENMFNYAYTNQITGKLWKSMFWTADKIQNLDISFTHLKQAARNELLQELLVNDLELVNSWIDELPNQESGISDFFD